MTLIAPTPYFIELTAFMTYMPVKKEVVETTDTGDWAKDPLKATSNGPFLLDTYTKDKGMVLIKIRIILMQKKLHFRK